MKLPKIREIIEAVKALIVGPYTSKFPKVPHVPHPNFRGRPKFDEKKCVGCLGCEEICPAGAIAHKDVIDNASTPTRTMIHYSDTCIFCGQCEASCISEHEGIKLSNEWELSFFDRKSESEETIKKELALCEICGGVIAAKDHLNWISEKLGELTYSSPTLYLARLKRLGIIDSNIISALKDNGRPKEVPRTAAKNIGSAGRSDRVKILCAPCRRETTLTTK